jgi:hypothetical protein
MSLTTTHSAEMREIKTMGEVNDSTQRKTKPVDIQRKSEPRVPVDSLGLSDYQSDEDDTGTNGPFSLSSEANELVRMEARIERVLGWRHRQSATA